MRYLNKIVFVNSATVRYQEILLDGNVHLIGTQGVGKSTLLRAILFFYNGDPRKLGIPREKKLFAEYYFPFANSYIVYEVQRESGSFSIILMRSGTGVQFRFVDAACDTDLLLSDQQALERWGEIREGLDNRGIDSSNRIDRLQEYRDIIYGNAEINPEYRKYSLLESKQYQNIPRTITNVFLNTRLEASFIKETIIHSLSEEELQIDLVRYRHHLRDFEREFEDIRTFKKPRTREQSEKVIGALSDINRSRTQLMDSSAMLGASLALAEKEHEDLKRQLSQREKERGELRQQSDKREKRQQDKVNLIVRDIKVLEDSIRKANKKEREYKERGIAEVLERSGRKQEWENAGKRLEEERQSLAAKFESVEQQFEVRLRQMANNLQQLDNEEHAQENILREEFQHIKEQFNLEKAREIAELRTVYDKSNAEYSRREKELLELRAEQREERSKVQEREWRAEEIGELKTAVHHAVAAAKEAETEQSLHREKREQLKKDWEREEEKLAAATETERVKLQNDLAVNSANLADVKSKLDNYQNALYGYLQSNYPEWQETIGRVAREDLLFSENLNPDLKKEAVNLLYGLKIDLNQVEVSAKSLEQYELEKKKLEEGERKLKKGIANVDVRLQENSDRLKKRFQPRLREQKELMDKLGFEHNRQNELEKKKRLQLSELEQKARVEKQELIDLLVGKIKETDEELIKVEKQQKSTKHDFIDKNQQLEKDYAKKIKREKEDQSQRRTKIAEQFKVRKADVKERIAKLEKQKSEKLEDAGADTERISALDLEIATAKAELKYIENNQELLFGYKKDKKELFDKVDNFRKDRGKKEEEQILAENRLSEIKKQHAIEFAKSGSAISGINEKISRIEDGFNELRIFSESDLYAEISEWLSDKTSEKGNPYQVRELLSSLRDHNSSLSKYREELRDSANRLLNNFSEANLFQFRTALTDQTDYMAFAADLKEFIDENKIVEYEKRVNSRFANILDLVSKETGDLISREGEIQKVISKVNGDFRQRNFVGVIQSMELKIEDSDNRVVRTLKRIRDYEQEHGFEYGEQNLFNSANPDDHNQRAVEFLGQLSRDIAEVKQEQIKLSDAFELRFRVVENENDSGWVEKLSNVGSEGTDVLVKAMINILLLNVFKESASRKFKDFRLHCMMDEIGRLHPTNVRGILKFANDRNILLINGSPVEQDAMAYRHIYELRKDKESRTRVRRLITVNDSAQIKS